MTRQHPTQSRVPSTIQAYSLAHSLTQSRTYALTGCTHHTHALTHLILDSPPTKSLTHSPACLQAVYDAADPASSPLPTPWSTRLDPFQRLLLLRVLRPDMLTTGIHSFVKSSMGQKFVESPPLDLEVCYSDSTATTPLIFVLSPGSDPMSMLLKFAERLKCQVRRLLQDGAHNEALRRS